MKGKKVNGQNEHVKRVENIICDVMAELARAMEKHPPVRVPHEGYAVILEELDELWDLIKKKDPPAGQMRKEAIQVAAMAVRFVLDLKPGKPAGDKKAEVTK